MACSPFHVQLRSLFLSSGRSVEVVVPSQQAVASGAGSCAVLLASSWPHVRACRCRCVAVSCVDVPRPVVRRSPDAGLLHRRRGTSRGASDWRETSRTDGGRRADLNIDLVPPPATAVLPPRMMSSCQLHRKALQSSSPKLATGRTSRKEGTSCKPAGRLHNAMECATACAGELALVRVLSAPTNRSRETIE
jgi:hypothetical protein